MDCCKSGGPPGGGSVQETGLLSFEHDAAKGLEYQESTCIPEPRAIVRKKAPEFEAMAWWNGFKKVRLSDFLGKYVVLFFYPMDFTFVCPTEIVQFADHSKDFLDSNCQIIGVSIDSQYTHMEYSKKDRKRGGLGKIDIPLVADVSKDIAKSYGCIIDENEADGGVAFRATYIIDDKGVARHVSVSDLPVGRNVEEVFRLVKAF